MNRKLVRELQRQALPSTKMSMIGEISCRELKKAEEKEDSALPSDRPTLAALRAR